MTVASETSPKKIRVRARLAPEKGRELAGLALLAAGLLASLALASYFPFDPSLLHRPAASAPVRNWIGPAGAQLAALAFGLFGPASLVVPVFLLVAGWRKLRGAPGPATVGRGFGAVLVLLALPALAQLTVGDFGWRGGTVAAGGGFGRLVGEAVAARLNLVGALVVLLATAAGGVALLVQSTLGEALARGRDRLKHGMEEAALARARRDEKREKEQARERVMAKHLERSATSATSATAASTSPTPPIAAGAPALLPGDLPLRVVERHGEGGFSLRRVAADDLARRSQAAPAAAETARRDSGPFAPRPASPPPRPARPAFEDDDDLPLVAPAGFRVPPPAASAPPTTATVTAMPSRQEALFTGRELPPPTELPPLSLLQLTDDGARFDSDALVQLGEVIRARCAEFGVDGTIEAINPGPVVTVYEYQPAPGVKVSQIVNLQDDLALALKATSVRIERLPGRSTLGIEVPNVDRSVIRLGPLLSDKGFTKSPSLLTLALGRTISGEPYFADLASMPHLLVAGATGSGKSVGLASMITSILYRARKDEVKFIFIDPKRIELGVYADIPHLAAEVVVDMKKAANALQRMVKEMEDRYRLLAEVHVRSIAYYNRAIQDPEVKRRLALTDDEGEGTPLDLKPLPYYVIVIDELADLMMVSTSEVETAIARLAQMARAVGIHLIVATQRPSVDVLTGTIKANFPCRMAFATASRHDSRTILDGVGAEQLLGKGDMLFMPAGTSRTIRLHGAFLSEQETASLIRWLKKTHGRPDYDPDLLKPLEEAGGGGEFGDSDDDLYDEAARMVVAEGIASASFLQRRLRVGFSRASRLIDMMERDGLLGPPQGSKPREVLVKSDYFSELDLARRE